MTRHNAAYAKKAAGMAAESKRQAAISRIAEPILEDLKEGTHQLTVENFRAVAEYLLSGEDDSAKLAKAFSTNTFSLAVPDLGEVFKFWCDPALSIENTESLASYARRTGFPRRSLRRYVATAKLNLIRVGREKRYLIHELDQLVATNSRKG